MGTLGLTLVRQAAAQRDAIRVRHANRQLQQNQRRLELAILQFERAAAEGKLAELREQLDWQDDLARRIRP